MEETRNHAEILKEEIRNHVEILKQVAGLDDGQAKACIYYGAVTHNLDTFYQVPMLEVIGPTGTGKSQILKFMHRISFNPYWAEKCGEMS